MSVEPFPFRSIGTLVETIGRSPDSNLAGDAPALYRPIILLSVMPRSGTNYLSALIALHPDCRPSRIPEDFFLANSSLLIRFCGSVAESWDEWWQSRLGGLPQLARNLGEALLKFADPGLQGEMGPDTRLVLRSPTLEGVESASTLFPEAQLLILVRDAPDTVESGRRSFGWGYDDGIRAWTRSVRSLLSFTDRSDPRYCCLVHFEDLVSDPVREIDRIIEFLQLDETQYPFQQINSIPILGSSSFGRIDGEPVHWRPVPKTDDFDPLSRAKGWPLRRQKRAAWLGAAERARLGYPVLQLSIVDKLLNVALDIGHGVRRAARCIDRCLRCRPRLLRGRQGLCLMWRHVTKYL
jgi:hypothetical protein